MADELENTADLQYRLLVMARENKNLCRNLLTSKSIFKMLPHAVFMFSEIDGQWQIDFVDGQVAGEIVAGIKDLKGENIRKGFVPQAAEAVISAIVRLQAGEKAAPFYFEIDLKTYVGNVQLADANIPDDGQPMTEVVGVISNISELLLGERRRKSLSLSGLVIFGQWRGSRRNWVMEDITPNFRQFGYEAQDLIQGKVQYTDLIHPHDRERVISTINSNCQSGVETFWVEYGLIKATGEVRWIHDITCEMQSLNGGILYSDAFIVDVTKQKTIEHQLQVSEERYTLAVDGAYDGIWDWDIINNQTYYSPRFLEILGFTVEDAPACSEVMSLIFPEDLERAKDILRLHLAGQTTHMQVEYRVKTKNNDHKWIFVRGKAIFNEQGQAVRMAGSITDISEQKEMEAKLRFLSLHDQLTGLYNRHSFENETRKLDELKQETLVAIIICDIDGLKQVNDTLGHSKGDELIITAANILKECFREVDMVARIGGDEFAVLLPGCSDEAVGEIVKRIRSGVARYNDLTPGFPLSISTGFATGVLPMSTIDALYKDADDNMYQEKKSHQSTRGLFFKQK